MMESCGCWQSPTTTAPDVVWRFPDMATARPGPEQLSRFAVNCAIAGLCKVASSWACMRRLECAGGRITHRGAAAHRSQTFRRLHRVSRRSAHPELKGFSDRRGREAITITSADKRAMLGNVTLHGRFPGSNRERQTHRVAASAGT